MKNNHLRIKRITPILQWIHVANTYPSLILSHSIKCSELVFTIVLSPSEKSIKYYVEIHFKNNGIPTAYLVKPKIQKFKGKLPKHLYKVDSSGRRPLCVYDPKAKEWNGSMLISETFIPWVLTWLNAYEFWQLTGKWEYNESKHLKNADLVGGNG